VEKIGVYYKVANTLCRQCNKRRQNTTNMLMDAIFWGIVMLLTFPLWHSGYSLQLISVNLNLRSQHFGKSHQTDFSHLLLFSWAKSTMLFPKLCYPFPPPSFAAFAFAE
jgi:hypothetical protein